MDYDDTLFASQCSWWVNSSSVSFFSLITGLAFSFIILFDVVLFTYGFVRFRMGSDVFLVHTSSNCKNFTIKFLLNMVQKEYWQLYWVKIILAVGTKLQGIITQMALEIQERHAVVQGIPLVQVTDKHFWFSWPELVLYLIHFVLFQVD